MGRPPIGDRPMTSAERVRRHRARIASGSEHVAAPEVVAENVRFAIARHQAGAEALRKIIKASRLEARKEIGVDIERLIRKWKIVLSALRGSTVTEPAEPVTKPSDREGVARLKARVAEVERETQNP